MRVFLLNLFLILTVFLSAQAPAGYYSRALGKADAQLKTTLYTIIKENYQTKSYDYLYTIYQTSDLRPDGKIWDMYSTCTWTLGTKQCGSYKVVCDCYNREHSIPQSWFNEASPMVSDAHHIYPTDGKVNGQRSNYPFGECSGGTTLSKGLGRLGSCTFPGYSGTVFEPVDEYKGDFARTYFYFATRYENIMTSIGGESFNNTVYPALSAWSINLFLKWHRQDPVSTKETDRNNAIYAHQKNRNPYIDYPELAEYIWGNLKGSNWVMAAIENPTDLANRFSFNQQDRTFKFSVDNKTIQYSVMNVSGQTVRGGRVLSNVAVSVSSLQPGIYIVRYEVDKLKAIRKFIIQ